MNGPEFPIYSASERLAESIDRRASGGSTSVLTAMSGGVDSSVAAALLVEQGYEVTGVMLHLWAECKPECSRANRCCTPEAVERARATAELLGIPFHLIDAEEAFKEKVVDYFITEYAAGRTPNPCILCNRAIRFGLLVDQALEAGADLLTTGHYARVRQADGGYQLLRGQDSRKDQSYFLHILGQEQLAHVRFPLGELTKDEVRNIARRRGLPVAEQPESQDICFVVDGDYRRFLEERRPDLFQPGPIRDTSGHVLGEHQGLPAYTIGQRKGLGISAPEPLYVLAIEPEENTLIVGPEEELGRDECAVGKMHYVSGDRLTAPFRAEAQIRYRAPAVAVEVTPTSPTTIRVHFDNSQRDITPGQFLVLYNEDIVLGGGVIQ